MNREIKFRVWDTQQEEMLDEVEVDYLSLSNLKRLPPEYIFIQYTGAKDYKGVEIYEGDIISEPCCLTECRENYHTHLVEYDISNQGFNIFVGAKPQIEIIGNKFEDPELLEDTDENK